MAEIALAAERRTVEGTRAARRLRTAGRIPGVLYGHGVEPTPLSVDARELRVALMTDAGQNALFDLQLEGKSHLAIARELQQHPVRYRIAHVDFQVVSRDELVPGEVPVHLIGEALSVTRQGGTFDHLVVSVPVHARPGEMPTAFELDISDLEIGVTLRVSDLVIPDGVNLDVDPDTAVIVAHAPRGTAAEDEAEAVAEAPAEADAES
jgi:large subunit ribosomal protein L25